MLRADQRFLKVSHIRRDFDKIENENEVIQNSIKSSVKLLNF